MPRNASDIDRLIEEGLTRYGAGDVDGALLVWEQVLASDPANPQANSYVDYVRTNYQVLTTEPGADEGTAQYGLEDEPDYQIEISSGQLAAGEAAPLYMDPADAGWLLENEQDHDATTSDGAAALTLDLEPPVPDDDPPALELEADEPPGSLELEADDPPEDATNAYPKGRARAESDFSETATGEFDGRTGDLTPGFGPEATPVGFNSQTTDVKKPQLGFVKPRGADTPELKVTLRTPPHGATKLPVEEPRPTDKPISKPFNNLIESLPSPRPAGPATRDLPDERRPPAIGPAIAANTLRPPADTRPPASVTASVTASGDGLRGTTRSTAPPLGSRDTLRPTGEPRPPASTKPTRPPEIVETTRQKAPTTPQSPHAASASPTSPTPASSQPGTRPPPHEPSPEEGQGADFSRAPTRQMPIDPPNDPTLGVAPTRDFSNIPTAKLPARPGSEDNGGEDLPSLSAPTRDLGLRPVGRAESPTMGDEEPTKESNVRQLRDEAARGRAQPRDGIAPRTPPPDVDPVDARSAQILEEVDLGASPDENKEDRTRRRISSLIDRALAWNGISEHDKAVAAVDLALSEDPNSALAQKMLQRHRDTIMTVFQNYIGDLQRTPALAKPLHELSNAPIGPRAAFLLSRVDGTLSIDELLDVSGMPRLEAYRYLCQLFLRGILR